MPALLASALVGALKRQHTWFQGIDMQTDQPALRPGFRAAQEIRSAAARSPMLAFGQMRPRKRALSILSNLHQTLQDQSTRNIHVWKSQ